MLDSQWRRKYESDCRRSYFIFVTAVVLFVIIGISANVYFTMRAAEIRAEATVRVAEMWAEFARSEAMTHAD